MQEIQKKQKGQESKIIQNTTLEMFLYRGIEWDQNGFRTTNDERQTTTISGDYGVCVEKGGLSTISYLIHRYSTSPVESTSPVSRLFSDSPTCTLCYVQYMWMHVCTVHTSISIQNTLFYLLYIHITCLKERANELTPQGFTYLKLTRPLTYYCTQSELSCPAAFES